jgi:hypothetical protein
MILITYFQNMFEVLHTYSQNKFLFLTTSKELIEGIMSCWLIRSSLKLISMIVVFT